MDIKSNSILQNQLVKL